MGVGHGTLNTTLPPILGDENMPLGKTNSVAHKRAKKLLSAAESYARYLGHELDTEGAATIVIPVIPTQYDATRVIRVSTKLITTLPKESK